MSELSESELLIAAKNRAWEVIHQWRGKPMCDDDTLAAMVANVVLGKIYKSPAHRVTEDVK